MMRDAARWHSSPDSECTARQRNPTLSKKSLSAVDWRKEEAGAVFDTGLKLQIALTLRGPGG